MRRSLLMWAFSLFQRMTLAEKATHYQRVIISSLFCGESKASPSREAT